MLLTGAGLKAVSVSNYPELLAALEGDEGFDLCILGHSIPEKEKLRIYHILQEKRPGIPILEMYRFSPDLKTGLSVSSQKQPEEFLETVLQILSSGTQKAG